MSIFEIVLCLIPLMLIAGSWIVYIKRRRGAPLVMLVAALFLLFGVLVEIVAGPSFFGRPRLFANTSFGQWAHIVAGAAIAGGVVLFSIGYVWYAISEKRI